MRPGRSVAVEMRALEGTARVSKTDDVVTEEPLELRLSDGAASSTLAITMRTPGNDFELAAGFLYDEAIVRGRDEIVSITYCLDSALDAQQQYNVVTIELQRGAAIDRERFERHFTIGSACGVCGRSELESLRELGVAPIEDDARIAAGALYELPARMREAQRTFDSTGGVHAAALFDANGTVLAVREDVGRHNAVDKIVGWGLLNRHLPYSGCVLLVSGRASYEIVQKSLMARIPIVCSVSAPSSLAVDLASEFNLTLVSFLRGDRANVYSAPERIA